MEAAWTESPQQRFWKRLLNENVDNLVNDPDQFVLKHMRHDHAMGRAYQKRFGPIFKERDLNLYELIAKACGEVWDEEDDEKGGVQLVSMKKSTPMKQRVPNAVSVDHPREVGVRERESKGHVVQTGDDLSEVQLQEVGQGCRETGGGRPQEEATREKKKVSEEGRGRRVKTQHTAGLGNVEEGRLAEALKPKKKRQRKRPVLGKAYQQIN